MERMQDMRINDEQQLLSEVNKYESIIIYGNNNMGKTLYRYMRKNGMEQKVIGFSGNNIKGKDLTLFELPLKKIKSYKAHKEDSLIIISVNNQNLEKAVEACNKLEFKNVVIIDYEFYCKLSKDENVPMRFLCAGFTKSGTTSLQSALRKHPKIFLPKQKETNYLHWRNNFEDSPERFATKFYAEAKEGKIFGNIEPTYHGRAVSAYECFGKDLKLIFMMRNPVDATYSYFKMMMRRSQYMQQVNYYKKFKKFDINMFDLYIDDYILSGKDKRYCYADYIEKYLEYFPKENIKFVFFEEIIKEPTRIMNEIQEFIGVEPKEYKSLPHSNSGKEVAKNYFSALVNHYLFKTRLKLMSNTNSAAYERYNKIDKFCKKRTLVENKEKMTEQSRETLNGYYKESIIRLEEICGRSLQGIWYE